MTQPAGFPFGTSMKRREDPRFITGRGNYTDDIKLPGTTYAVFVRSPYAHAKVRGIELSAARKSPGVSAIFTGKELAEGGMRVAILEEGEWWDTDQMTARPREMTASLYRDAVRRWTEYPFALERALCLLGLARATGEPDPAAEAQQIFRSLGAEALAGEAAAAA